MTMAYSFGDVVLVPFPFTNQSGTKRRPAVIISSSNYNTRRHDVVIMAITSQIRTTPGFGEAQITDWQSAGLIKPSILKPVFTTIEQNLILRSMGTLSPSDLQTLRGLIPQVIG